MHPIHFLSVVALATSLAAQNAPGSGSSITSPSLHRTRAVWFVQSENPVGAEVGFAWQPLPWDDSASKAWQAAPGTRFALGHDAWAALETFTELEFGKVEVKAGNYYAMLEKDKNGARLGLLDADKARALQLAPGGGKLPFVATIPLQVDKLGDGNAPLDVRWDAPKEGGTAALVLTWGPHRMRAEAKVRGSEAASPIVLPDQRGCSRTLFWKGKGNPSGERTAFAVIDHGIVAWNDKLATEAAGMKPGTRWRMGKDWATTLDTNVALTLGDKKLGAGSWHLTLGKTKDGWQLVVSSAAADHKNKLDGFAAQYVTAVLEVPMQSAPSSPPADKLQVSFAGEGDALQLLVAFGPERLTVPVALGR
ncbi:MAG TPA: DUF2911 domain-containing protein [Planctomycetota bacterium]|nr:DUF2911 domain-containing protein [Planctomycetota bacterium]